MQIREDFKNSRTNVLVNPQSTPTVNIKQNLQNIRYNDDNQQPFIEGDTNLNEEILQRMQHTNVIPLQHGNEEVNEGENENYGDQTGFNSHDNTIHVEQKPIIFDQHSPNR